ncbi:hypothetical protein CLU79DRAFT_717976 [Phycomyces nitens]|nr:hypothetical protein CLU79DRAFT_717976 [Phycomyces nitens]
MFFIIHHKRSIGFVRNGVDLVFKRRKQTWNRIRKSNLASNSASNLALNSEIQLDIKLCLWTLHQTTHRTTPNIASDFTLSHTLDFETDIALDLAFNFALDLDLNLALDFCRYTFEIWFLGDWDLVFSSPFYITLTVGLCPWSGFHPLESDLDHHLHEQDQQDYQQREKGTANRNNVPLERCVNHNGLDNQQQTDNQTWLTQGPIQAQRHWLSLMLSQSYGFEDNTIWCRIAAWVHTVLLGAPS